MQQQGNNNNYEFLIDVVPVAGKQNELSYWR